MDLTENYYNLLTEALKKAVPSLNDPKILEEIKPTVTGIHIIGELPAGTEIPFLPGMEISIEGTKKRVSEPIGVDKDEITVVNEKELKSTVTIVMPDGSLANYSRSSIEELKKRVSNTLDVDEDEIIILDEEGLVVSNTMSTIDQSTLQVIRKPFGGGGDVPPTPPVDQVDKELLLALIRAASHHLNLQRQERLNQARTTFIIALAALILGVILVFTGVVCIFAINLPVGAATAASSIIIDLVSALTFKFNKEANDRLDSTTKELSILDRTSVAMHYISYISGTEKKDQAIMDLINLLYTSSSNENDLKKG